MKIAMIGHKRIPTRSGGVEVVVEELAVRMAKLGHEVYVYNRNSGEEKLSEYKGVHVIETPTFKSSALNAMVYSLFATLHAIFHRYDVVHYHAEGPCAMLPLAKLFGKATVATIHGLDWQRAKWGGFAVKYLLFGEKAAAKHAGRLIMLTNVMSKYFKETYGREGTVIPNGVNPATTKAPDIIKEKFGLSGGDYILFLARITREKGLDYLLDAFSRIETDKKLVIAGSVSPTNEYIDSILKKAAPDKRIIFADFVSGDTMRELYSNCYTYVLPSDIEGMPLSLLEAISYHARILASDIPEITSVLGDYGNTFKKGDAESLRKQLQYMLDRESLIDSDFKDTETPEMTSAKEKAILDAYNWDEITAKTLEVYADICGIKA